MSDLTIHHHEQAERKEGRCACGGTIRLRHWCIAADSWAGSCALEGERCELYADEICEGQRPYNYCKTCGSKEEV